MPRADSYAGKRSFDVTPEPPGEAVSGNVEPGGARAGASFVVHQHHARRLHYDLRLEMFNGDVPVLVSWAVPKGLPLKKGKPHLAVHVEDHPFEYGSFSGTIPAGEYGAGEVRIFDAGTYELLEQAPGKLSFRLKGTRLKGVWHLNHTKREQNDWLVIFSRDERGPRDPLPELTPMGATLVAEPFDDDGWIYEVKWDGVRALAVCEEETVLVSRNRRDITGTYPELADIHRQLVAVDAVVDGEIVAMSGGRPSFERLQGRINLQNERDIKAAMSHTPVSFVAFDVLYLDGHSLLNQPLEDRKAALSELIVPSDRIQASDCVEREGVALFEAARAQGLEGIVAKKLGCPYRPGRRSKEWLKVKTILEADLVIGGWTKGEGSRSQTFGALLVGAYDDGDLRFLGAVGTGFSDRMLAEVLPKLRELEVKERPFVDDPTAKGPGPFGKTIKNPHWARPELVASIEFRELTSGYRLRAPSFKGLRPDLEPKHCTLGDLAALPGR